MDDLCSLSGLDALWVSERNEGREKEKGTSRSSEFIFATNPTRLQRRLLCRFFLPNEVKKCLSAAMEGQMNSSMTPIILYQG